MPCCLASPIWSGLEDTPFMMRPPRRISAVRGMLLLAAVLVSALATQAAGLRLAGLFCGRSGSPARQAGANMGMGRARERSAGFLLERRKSAPLAGADGKWLANLPAMPANAKGVQNGRAFR